MDAKPLTPSQSRTKHLEMILTIVARMASNSFQVKTWCVTLVSALLALANKEGRGLVFIAYLPVFTFWWLDAFFLHQERLFRALYDHVRAQPDKEADFSMNTQLPDSKVAKRRGVMWSPTLRLFYGSLFVIVGLVALGLYRKEVRQRLGW